MGERIDIMLDEEEVNEKIKELGKKISHDYAGKEVYMVCILKGVSQENHCSSLFRLYVSIQLWQ